MKLFIFKATQEQLNAFSIILFVENGDMLEQRAALLSVNLSSLAIVLTKALSERHIAKLMSSRADELKLFNFDANDLFELSSFFFIYNPTKFILFITECKY